MSGNKYVRPVTVGILLALQAVLTFLIQSIFLPSLGLGMPVYLLMPLTAAAAMFEKDPGALFFGVFTGVLSDLISDAPDGIYALFFAAFALLAGRLSAKYFRVNLTVMMLLSVAGTFALCLFSFVVNGLNGSFDSAALIIKGFYFPAFIVTCACAPVFYYTVRLTEMIKNETI